MGHKQVQFSTENIEAFLKLLTQKVVADKPIKVPEMVKDILKAKKMTSWKIIVESLIALNKMPHYKQLQNKNEELETKVRTLVTRNEELELEVETLTKGASTEAVEEKVEDGAPKTEAETPTGVGETSTKTKEVVHIETPPHHQCTFRTMAPDKEVVHCSKDYDTKGIIHPVTDEVCSQCWNRLQKRTQLDSTIGAKLPCVSRIQQKNGFFCGRNAPRITKLALGIKTCLACPHRMTEEIAEQKGITLWTHTYVTCGGLQKRDPKVGLMIECKPDGRRWVTIDHCKKKRCPQVKTVRYTKL